MSEWAWEYVPDAPHVLDGLTRAQIDEVESLASRLVDAVGVRRIGTPFDVRESVSNVKSYGEGPVMIWFLEDYRDDVVLVVRVQHFGSPQSDRLSASAIVLAALPLLALVPVRRVVLPTDRQIGERWTAATAPARDEYSLLPARY